MGVVYNTSTVTDGLVLYVDAGNTKSYSGSGVVWGDLSGKLLPGITLVNGPVYSTENGGIITFDGVNDYVTNNQVTFPLANNLFADANGSWTVSAWFKLAVSPVGGGTNSFTIVGRGGGVAGVATFALMVELGSPPTYLCRSVLRGVRTTISPGVVNDGLWHNAVVAWDGSAGRGYFDGADAGALSVGTAAVQSNDLNIATTGNGGSAHLFPGPIPTVSIYNRALSATEIQQNFNALRGRFGI